MFKKIMAIAALSIGLSASASFAATCGGNYTVKSGDYLSQIAKDLYGDTDAWSAIYNSNADVIGDTPSLIYEGMVLHLACINGKPEGLEGGTDVSSTAEAEPITVAPGTAQSRKKISILVADDYKPFMDRSLPNGGMVIDVMQKVMEAADPKEGVGFYWVNDFSAHLEPLLSNALLDVGVPWLRPACETNPDAYRCQNFYFSDPMFEMLILLFTNKDNPITYTQDSDIEGLNLCRPAGYYTHDLDKNGRNWVKDAKITLTRPHTMTDCFNLLMEGKVDAVAANEFTGRAEMKQLGIKDKVVVIDTKPLSIEGLHVLVHKTHPRAKELLDLINGGLRDIKASGEYQKIIDAHLSRIYSDF